MSCHTDADDRWYYTRTMSPDNRSIVANEDDGSKGKPYPRIFLRSGHNLSRTNISPNALKVLYRLRDAGFQAYLVGGGVRDLLLGREPKDFDVGTDAHPDQVRKLFRNCRLIGRRFRLAHILFGREVIEVATFRGLHDQDTDLAHADRHIDEEGRIVRDNVFGTIEEDAWRRDFTVNALYYSIADFSVLDFVGGMGDLEAGLLRLIGDPEQRYREDPVRILRVIRFAAKLGFRIHPDTERPIRSLGHLLRDIPPARLFEETLKLFMGGTGLATFELLRHYGIFTYLFPLTEKALEVEEQGFPITMVMRALENTDLRVNRDQPVTPAFLFAVLLWEPMRMRAQKLRDDGMRPLQAMQIAATEVVTRQLRHTSLPKRFSLPMRELWMLQPRLEQKPGRRSLKLLTHPRFRAAYDFLLMRCAAGEAPEELGNWWTEVQEASADQRERLVQTHPPARRRGRRSGS
jgi:poly(A) polymerase